MAKSDFRELAEHKSDRYALEFMNSTAGHCVPRRKHNPRNEANVLTSWSNLPIPRVMFDAFIAATSYFTVVHVRFNSLSHDLDLTAFLFSLALRVHTA
jgi:hypothetical protein